MPRIDPKYQPFVGPLLVWPILLVIQLGARSDFGDFLEAGFWLDLGGQTLRGLAIAFAGAGGVFAYVRFCRWFDRTIEGERAKIAARINSRDGDLTWPASHPLHDRELDS